MKAYFYNKFSSSLNVLFFSFFDLFNSYQQNWQYLCEYKKNRHVKKYIRKQTKIQGKQKDNVHFFFLTAASYD